MLYVFHVDAGQMTTYDMELTLQSVASLKAAIERKTKIPSSSLVLLISGGEVLQSDHMVSSYSAGTDSNPIYMFSKPSVKESHLKQSMCDLSPIVELSTGEFRSDIRSAFDGKSVAELKNAVELCCSLPPNIHTVISYATLAQQFGDLAHEVSRSCDQLVHEQHLQHQGWSAVIANLEDIFNEFCERSRSFKESFRKHRLKKEEYHEKLNTLNEVLESLGKIPILPALQLNAEAHRFSAFDVFEETDFEGHHYGAKETLDSSSERTADFGVGVFKLSEEDVFEQPSTSNEGASDEAPDKMTEGASSSGQSEGATFKVNEEHTLLHWILAQGNQASLQDILDYCQKGLALIDAEPLKEREAELYNILEYANVHGLKQIKGIEDRLYALEQLLSDVKKKENEQHVVAASLIQHRDRLNSGCDPSVLPTLLESNQCQLGRLLKGHELLVDIRRRIMKSKDELSRILKARLEAVLVIENSMSVQDAHAMLSFQCFNRLARYFGIVAQLHRAPAVFVRAVHEVARRRTFSQHHLQWATDLASKLIKIHEEEISRRQEFNSHFEDHFLKSLFPGMTDLPPPFATQAPSLYDSRLPELTDTDVEYISEALPDWTSDVPKYDMESTVKFFQQRLNTSDHEDKDADVQVDFDKDFESETDTDFEKLSRQSEKQKNDISTSCVPHTMAVSTVTEVGTLPVIPESPRVEFLNSEFYIEESLPSSLEWGRDERQDNMDTHKINMEKLQDLFVKLFNVCKINIVLIKDELTKLKSEVDGQKKFINTKYLEITEAWEKVNEHAETRFREQTQRLTVDHELELSDMKAALNEKDDVISNLKKETEDMKMEHQKETERLDKEHKSTKELLDETRKEIKAFEKKLEEAEVQKQKDIKEMQEKMHLEYKAEIESLRSRFRLVALTNNMDRSPSESSLEKIERTDVIEIVSHNAILMQTKQNAEVEKEEAVKEAVEKCKAEWEQKLNAEICLLKAKYEAEKQVTINDVTRRLLSEKDRQLELLREREQTLVRECCKYRDTIQQLTDPETNDYDSLLKTQFATFENEKAVLLQQVASLKAELEKKTEEADKRREEDSDGRSSPRRDIRRRSHTPLGLSPGALTLALGQYPQGHTVLVMWDPAHLNYTVLQEASIMHFVHSDCLPSLDLSIHVKNESERRLYAVATVESKEYCYAKRGVNRYHMPRGSRFYRVHVKPLKPPLPPPACCDHKHKPDAMKGNVLPVFNRPLRKWLTNVHADMQKSIDTSQSSSSNADKTGVEVATATLINLESPVSAGEPPVPMIAPEDQLDSIETEHKQHKMQLSTTSAVSEMDLSVGRVVGAEAPGAEPVELTVSAVSVVARGSAPPGSELAEEAAP
ncbi:RB1-inducible coiled-coil protein 1 isoform X3 [Danaus plexippus]|uniref:RB1-inducible coiled-coil protein 1 isoform X3 n=1 Tax=Danaus plexippus TaxID=13037 RepID=UPI002AB30B85|nr:RB1-inducible coiled-coil protein 1 isoform X3 [Danaus plexippus]